MIKICCVYYQDKYTPEYITRLRDGLRKHCTRDFEFICYSDTDVDADRVIPLPDPTPIKRHWHKLRFFDYSFIGPGDIIVLDIDQLVVSNIDEMVNWCVADYELVSYNKWWGTQCSINGGWYKFRSGCMQFIWDKFNDYPEYWQTYYFRNSIVHYNYYGEELFVEQTAKENRVTITTMPGEWVGVYTESTQLLYNRLFGEPLYMDNEFNDKVKIIHQAGIGRNIHESDLRMYW